MVSLECIEDNCSFKTQCLKFDQAEKLLDLHLRRQHPLPGAAMDTAPPNNVSSPTINATPSTLPSSSSDACYGLLRNLPQSSTSASVTADLNRHGLANIEVHIIETEAGRLTGDAVVMLSSPGQLERLLGLDLDSLYPDMGTRAMESDRLTFLKHKKKQGNDLGVYIRLKGNRTLYILYNFVSCFCFKVWSGQPRRMTSTSQRYPQTSP